MSLCLEFSRERESDLNGLMYDTGAKNLKELVNNALSILEWAVHEVKDGNEIAAINEQKEVYRVLMIEILAKTSEIAQRRRVA